MLLLYTITLQSHNITTTVEEKSIYSEYDYDTNLKKKQNYVFCSEKIIRKISVNLCGYKILSEQKKLVT